MQGRALLSKTTLYCICQGSVLHVHAFRTTHVCATFLCTALEAFFFIVFPSYVSFFSSVRVCTALLPLCALHSSWSCAAGVHILHCVHASLCESCDWLCQRCGLHGLQLRTTSGALILLLCTARKCFSLCFILSTTHIKWSVDYNFLENYYLMICG